MIGELRKMRAKSNGYLVAFHGNAPTGELALERHRQRGES